VVLDRTGRLYSAIAAQATRRNAKEIYDWSSGTRGRQIRPAFRPEECRPPTNANENLELALSQRVRSKELFAFLIIGENAVPSDAREKAQIAYHTQTPTYVELPEWLERVLNEEIHRLRFENAQVDANLVKALTQKKPVERLGLVKVGPSGLITKAKKDNQIATFGVPFVSMFLLFMLVMSSAPALLNTVLEEKMQKIAEVLISSVSPFQLMLGKMLGAVLVSLTLSVLYFTGIAFSIWRFGVADLVPITHYFWFLLFQLLALMIFGSIFSAVGAACNEIRDAQSMMFPAMLIIMIPMFVWMPVLQSPSSTFSRVISLFPPVTPMLMMLRIAIPPGPPWWEILLGVVLTTLFMLACVWASAKIFRVGILSQGQTPSFRRLISWVISR